MSMSRYLYVMVRASLASMARVPARAWRGRPSRIIIRFAAAAAVWLVTGYYLPGTAPAIAIQATAALWWLDTTRTELDPPQATPHHLSDDAPQPPRPDGDGSTEHPEEHS